MDGGGDRRGLPNLKNTVEAAKELIRPEVVELFDKYDVYDRQEMAARYDIMLDIYTRRILIEARTMAEMARTQLYPAISRYLTEAAQAVKALGISARPPAPSRISWTASHLPPGFDG